MAAMILLIEDHPDNKKLIAYLLEKFGHHVRTASTGEEGLEIALRETFDLIICDIDLPEIDGYDVACRLKSDPLWHKVPLIAVTALAMVGDRDKVLNSGFDGYIAKPIVPQTFTQEIESFLPDVSSPPSSIVNADNKPIV
jgi:two-component system cell cycle response regulator